MLTPIAVSSCPIAPAITYRLTASTRSLRIREVTLHVHAIERLREPALEFRLLNQRLPPQAILPEFPRSSVSLLVVNRGAVDAEDCTIEIEHPLMALFAGLPGRVFSGRIPAQQSLVHDFPLLESALVRERAIAVGASHARSAPHVCCSYATPAGDLHCLREPLPGELRWRADSVIYQELPTGAAERAGDARSCATLRPSAGPCVQRFPFALRLEPDMVATLRLGWRSHAPVQASVSLSMRAEDGTDLGTEAVSILAGAPGRRQHAFGAVAARSDQLPGDLLGDLRAAHVPFQQVRFSAARQSARQLRA